MFEDMRDSCIIGRVRLEANAEHIVFVFPCHMKIVRAGLVMLKMQGCQLEFRYMLRTEECKAMELLARFRVLSELRDSSAGSSFGCVPEHSVIGAEIVLMTATAATSQGYVGKFLAFTPRLTSAEECYREKANRLKSQAQSEHRLQCIMQ